jgi:hypothetical protein
MGKPPINGVEFGTPVPQPGDRWIPVVQPRAKAPITVRVLSSKVLSTMVHWVPNALKPGSGHSAPHTKPDDTCPLCIEMGQVPRWHGYLGAWHHSTSRVVIVDLSVHAIHACSALDPARGHDLRGLELRLYRAGAGNNSKMMAELSKLTYKDDELPDAPDVAKCLARLWGLNNHGMLRFGDAGAAL